jgi:hypothetical protein
LRKYGIAQRVAAGLCGVNHRTFERWMKNRPSMPFGAWELLQIKIVAIQKKSNRGTIATVSSPYGDVDISNE